MTRETLAANIRRARLAAGLTQVRAATLAGVNLKTWVLYEKGEIRPASTRIPAIASALDAPIAALFDPTVAAEIRLTQATADRVRTQGIDAVLASLTEALRQPLAQYVATKQPETQRNAGHRPSRNDVALRLVERRRAAVRLAELALAEAERDAEASRRDDAVQ